MATIKHILFPFDFSQQALLAAPFVRAIANHSKSRITLLSVLPPVWDTPLMGMPATIAVDPLEMERNLKSRLEGALTKEFAGLDVQRLTDSGDPGLKITEFAHANSVDLIMMPTHGCGVFRSLLVGSVTAKVLHDARCPVWTATHAEEQRSPGVFKTILCAVDGSPQKVELLQWAWTLSQEMGAVLKLLHVVPPISDWLALPAERELQEQMREEGRSKLEALKRWAAIQAEVRVAVGSITETVTEEARQERADLVVIGRGSLQSPLGRIRTHTYGIIQKSPCPVVSV